MTRRPERRREQDSITMTASWVPSSVISLSPCPGPGESSPTRVNDSPFIPYPNIGMNQTSGGEDDADDVKSSKSCKSLKNKSGSSKIKTKYGGYDSVTGTDTRSDKVEKLKKKSGERTSTENAENNVIPVVVFPSSHDQGVAKNQSNAVEFNNFTTMNSTSSSSSGGVNALPSILKVGHQVEAL